MLLLLLIYVVLRALWKIDVYLKSILVNKSLYYYYRLKVYGVTLHAPAITTQQGKQHGHQTRKRMGLIITNSQNMLICCISLFLQYVTPFEHICFSFPIF